MEQLRILNPPPARTVRTADLVSLLARPILSASNTCLSVVLGTESFKPFLARKIGTSVQVVRMENLGESRFDWR